MVSPMAGSRSRSISPPWRIRSSTTPGIWAATRHSTARRPLVATARPTTLRRALNNLVDNALHYGGNVRVVLKATDSEVVIRIEDDGPGIPEDMLGEVIQPFVRIDGARSRNTHGMGLGLAIAQDAVQLEGGSISLSNQEGGGLRATVRLPLRKP